MFPVIMKLTLNMFKLTLRLRQSLFTIGKKQQQSVYILYLPPQANTWYTGRPVICYQVYLQNWAISITQVSPALLAL